jgi:DNA-binding HxlR family transcriptional regulator
MEPLAQTQISIFNPICPSRYTLSLLADKWTMLIVVALKHAPMRNGELKRKLGDISQKMLTQTLRELESNGIVQRTIYEVVPPHVEYSLTPLGVSLEEPIKAMAKWAEAHWSEVLAARESCAKDDDNTATDAKNDVPT